MTTTEHAQRSGERLLLMAFAATLFLSALLLFSVQPMFAKMVLPLLGGTPAVWAVSLCFFQGLLLLGYAYAHVLDAYLAPGKVISVHLAVMVAALVMLPVGVSARWADPSGSNAYLWLVAVLTASVGLPFFALSANAPLLQSWFGRLGHAQSHDPYFLYGASNVGSLAALIAYPFAIEPLWPLSLQSRLWTAGYIVLGLLIALCGRLMLQRGRQADAGSAALTAADEPAAADPIAWSRRGIWILLAFVPSGLLVAFTTFLTTDLASAPLLWVIPLALFLATFILTFRDPPAVSLKPFLLLQPVAIAVALAAQEWNGAFAWGISALAGLVAFFATCVICHRALYERRPSVSGLTEFYLWMSLGGVLGGVSAAIIAPLTVTSILEFPILLAAGVLCRPDVLGRLAEARSAAQTAAVAVTLAAAVAAAAWLWHGGLLPAWQDVRLHGIAVVGLLLIAALAVPRLLLPAAVALVAAVALLPTSNAPLFVTRSFFGTHKVVATPGGAFHILMHGTTLHGAELVKDASGRRPQRPTPILYYHPKGPLALSVALARRTGGRPHPLNAGVVGLGAGTMACFSAPGDHWRFFELDPAVVHIALTPAYFSYLSACDRNSDIVVGDARLTLAKQQPGTFDYLLIDAFSSDSIPIHLLTVEALRLYVSLLSPNGVLALHVSNQNLDLPPIVEANLAAIPGIHAVYAEGEAGDGALASQVILVARDAAALAPALNRPKSRNLGPGIVRPWTDDYSGILSPLIRRQLEKAGWMKGPSG